MKTKIIIAVAILAIALGAAWYIFVKRDVGGGLWPEITFVSQEGESVSVVFNNKNNTATLTGGEYTNLVFTQAISASGARYVNEESGLVLWNKGDEITLYSNEEPIFIGISESAKNIDEVVLDARDSETPHVSPILESDTSNNGNDLTGTWMWLETRHSNAKVVTPNKEGVFSIALDASGKRVVGTTDCNGFFGQFTLGSNNSITVGPLASTLMYCEGSQEEEFSKAVSDATSYSFASEGRLVLSGPTSVVTFVKK